jgi:hypothetical protein
MVLNAVREKKPPYVQRDNPKNYRKFLVISNASIKIVNKNL